MSVLTFAHRDECWKKGKNPFKKNKFIPSKKYIFSVDSDDMEAIEKFRVKLDNFFKSHDTFIIIPSSVKITELKGGVKRGNRK